MIITSKDIAKIPTPSRTKACTAEPNASFFSWHTAESESRDICHSVCSEDSTRQTVAFSLQKWALNKALNYKAKPDDQSPGHLCCSEPVKLNPIQLETRRAETEDYELEMKLDLDIFNQTGLLPRQGRHHFFSPGVDILVSFLTDV